MPSLLGGPKNLDGHTDFIKHMQAMVCTTEMTGSCCPICRAVIADDIKMYKP